MDSLKSLSPHFLTFTRYLPGQLKGLGEPENHRIEDPLCNGGSRNRVETCGLVVHVESKSKYSCWTLCDGIGSVKCIQWISSQFQDQSLRENGNLDDNLPEIGLKEFSTQNLIGSVRSQSSVGNFAIVKGKLTRSIFKDKDLYLLVTEIRLLKDRLSDLQWFYETIHLQKNVYPLIPTKQRIIPSKNFATEINFTSADNHTFQLWESFKALSEGSAFQANDLDNFLSEPRFGFKNSLEAIRDWIGEGLIYKSVDERYRMIPCQLLERVLYQPFKAKSSRMGLHPRFLWNSLRTDGYEISLKGVALMLDNMCIQSSHRPSPLTSKLPSGLYSIYLRSGYC